MNRIINVSLLLATILSICLTTKLQSQKTERTFIFGHSLIHHEFQVIETPSQETSVPHWLHFLAEASGNEYATSGQYGFLPQHAMTPPFSQWGFDFVPPVWDSDNEPFSAADFTKILITPGNFIQWQGPDEKYPSDNITPIEATEAVFQWCNAEEDNLSFFIYENWGDMAPYLSQGFPPTESEFSTYNDYILSDFHNWFLEYYSQVKESFPNNCIRMIPVGPVISNLLNQAPYNAIPVTELYEDDAPHGRATTYFLAAITTYMSIYEEKPSYDYEVEDIIHPTIRDNYREVVDFIWDNMKTFRDQDGELLAFCSELTSTTALEKTPFSAYHILQNNILVLKSVHSNSSISIIDNQGKVVQHLKAANEGDLNVSTKMMEAGIYHVIMNDTETQDIRSTSFVKL